MTDGWTDKRHRSLINFLVYSPAGTCFVKSVDASGFKKTGNYLFNLFCQVIDWVGLENVVHVVTDNASNYRNAGEQIHEHYGNIYWTPCVAHTLNLILKDIGQMCHVKSLARRAIKISVFAYNHGPIYFWLKTRDNWKEIVRPGATRFATTILSLQSVLEHKYDLEALVISEFFRDSEFSSTLAGRDVKSIVLDQNFWDNCDFMIKMTVPIVKLLHIVDSNGQPTMGYVHDGMIRVSNAMKATCGNKVEKYKPFIDIVNKRWDKQLSRELFVAAYYLNPAFKYSDDFDDGRKVKNTILDLLENKALCPDPDVVSDELSMYSDRIGKFGRKIALDAAKKQQLAKWWNWYGIDVPNLQKLAIRILSQSAASSGCERNWNVFERVHTKRRNRLMHKMLSDLVFVNYNMRLKNREYYNKKNKDCYDPISIESVDSTSHWLLQGEEDREMELDGDELDRALEEEVGSLNNEDEDEGNENKDVDFSTFGVV